MPTAVTQPKARHLILNEIKRAGGLTVRQLASILRITTVAVRKQLAVLEREGLVRARQVKIPRGRPASTYELTARARELFPQTYNHVLIDILEDLRDLDGDEKVKSLLDKRNERLLERYGRRIAGQTARRTGARVGHARDEDGYMATFEKDGGRLVLTEHNWPHIRDGRPAAPNLQLRARSLSETAADRGHSRGHHDRRRKLLPVHHLGRLRLDREFPPRLHSRHSHRRQARHKRIIESIPTSSLSGVIRAIPSSSVRK